MLHMQCGKVLAFTLNIIVWKLYCIIVSYTYEKYLKQTWKLGLLKNQNIRKCMKSTSFSQGREEKNSHELKSQSGNKTQAHEGRKNENSGHGKVARGTRIPACEAAEETSILQV